MSEFLWPVNANSPALPYLAFFSMAGILILTVAVQRFFFHPLSQVPGSKLGALTDWWLYYHELKGIVPFTAIKIQQRVKSPIVRLGPNRVIIHDPTQYDKIYRMGSKFMKDDSFYMKWQSAAGGGTTVTATSRQRHAERRKLSSANLSRQNVTSMHNLIAEKLTLLIEIFEESAKEKTTVDVFAGWRSMTMDIISTFAFGYSLNSLSCKKLDHHMLSTIEMALNSFYAGIRIPIFATLEKIPKIGLLFPEIGHVIEFKAWARECIRSYKPKQGTKYLFDALMTAQSSETLSLDEIQNEALDLLIAGSDTTATTLTYACICLAKDPLLWEKIYEEVKQVYRDPSTIPQSRELEGLPFLTACIKESLRLASPVPAYLWRIVPEEGYTLTTSEKTYFIPPGVSVGMSAYAMHYDSSLFPEPTKFLPTRWLGPDSGTSGPNGDLDKYLVPFSKGTRQCGGINMAWMELYMALAAMAVKFKVKGLADEDQKMEQKEYFVGVLQGHHWDVFYEMRG